MNATEVLVGIAVAVGVVGVIVPVLPGSVLILGAVLVWAIEDGSRTAWTVFAVVALFLVIGAIVKYAVPGRRLKNAGVPNRTLMLGGVLGLVGFFVVPWWAVPGVRARRLPRRGPAGRPGRAWPSTRHALLAVGISVLIELAAALFAAVTWFTGALLT